MLLFVAVNAMAGWTKCTSMDDLTAGSYYMIVSAAKYGGNYYYVPSPNGALAAGKFSSSGGAGVRSIDDPLKLGLTEAGWKVVPAPADGEFRLQSANNTSIYLYVSSADNNKLAAGELTATNADSTWVIEKHGTDATFKLTYKKFGRDLCNYTSSPYGFRTYLSSSTSGVHYVVVYKYVASGVSTPVISVATGTYTEAQNVTISQTENKTIYYTTDGTDPKTSATAAVYNGAITVSETTTIKAAAKDGETWSDVAVSVITIKKAYTTLASLLADIDKFATDSPVTLKTDGLVVTGVSGSSAFFTDNNGNGIQLYQSSHGFAAGDKLSGTVDITAVKYNTSGIPYVELKGLTKTTTGLNVTSGQKADTLDITLADLNANKNGVLVKISNLTYDAATASFRNGNDSIVPYNTFCKLPELYDEATYTVYGVVVVFSNKYEIAPRDASDVVMTSNLEVPTLQWKIDSKVVSADTILVGQTSAARLVTDSDGALTYVSSDTTVATVSETGVITAVAPGTAVITATTAKTEEYLKGVAEITIKVFDPNTDVITPATIGVTGYADWSGKTDGSGAVYAGNTSKYTNNSSNAIQMRNNTTTPSGIVVTASDRYVSKITFVFNPNTVSPQTAPTANPNYREVSVFKRDSAYTSAADLYDANKKGTLVEKIDNKEGNGTYSVTFTDNVRYFGIVTSGAVYFDKIIVEWGSTALGVKTVETETIDLNAPCYNLAGQRVPRDTKGIIVINGKKYLNK